MPAPHPPLHVLPGPDGWTLQLGRTYDTQEEAELVGREATRTLGSELVVHRPDGEIRDRDSHGHDSPRRPG